MIKIIKILGGRKYLLAFISLALGIVFPKSGTFIASIFGIYCGGNGIVSISMKKKK